MSQLQPPYRIIRDGLNKGKIIPFLGSGASQQSRKGKVTWKKGRKNYLPNTKELTLFLAEKSEFPSDEIKNLANVSQYFQVIVGRRPLYKELHDIFNCDYPIMSIHKFLAEIATSLLIVTTNYDDLIERAFLAKGRTFDLVIHTIEPEKVIWWRYGDPEPIEVLPKNLDIDLNSVTVIYKMHGAVDRDNSERDQYVITEDDYLDFMVRMYRKKAIPAIFLQQFQERHFLFLGHGLHDWNLRLVLRELQINAKNRQFRDLKSWAIKYMPNQIERRFWMERGVELYDMTVEEFIKKLKLV